MTFVQDATAKKLDMKHYVEKIKEHEARRASFNERQEYWRKYFESKLDKSQSDTGVASTTIDLE